MLAASKRSSASSGTKKSTPTSIACLQGGYIEDIRIDVDVRAATISVTQSDDIVASPHCTYRKYTCGRRGSVPLLKFAEDDRVRVGDQDDPGVVAGVSAAWDAARC